MILSGDLIWPIPAPNYSSRMQYKTLDYFLSFSFWVFFPSAVYSLLLFQYLVQKYSAVLAHQTGVVQYQSMPCKCFTWTKNAIEAQYVSSLFCYFLTHLENTLSLDCISSSSIETCFLYIHIVLYEKLSKNHIGFNKHEMKVCFFDFQWLRLLMIEDALDSLTVKQQLFFRLADKLFNF